MVEMHRFEKLFVNSKLSLFFHKWFGICKVLDWIEVKKEKKLLEIGCGTGITTKLIASKFNKVKIIALDYDKSQIKIAKEKQANRNIDFVVGDAKNLRFKNNSFDIIFASLALHHIPEYEKAIKEVYRVLKKGGRLIVLEHATKTLNILHNIILIQPVEFTKIELVNKLIKAGFVVRKTKGKLIFRVEAVKV